MNEERGMRMRLNRVAMIKGMAEKKVNNKDLSIITGLSYTTISNLKNGKRNVTLESAMKIATALEVSVESLIVADASLLENEQALDNALYKSGFSAGYKKGYEMGARCESNTELFQIEALEEVRAFINSKINEIKGKNA